MQAQAKTRHKKRFALLRRIFWRTYYGFVELLKRLRWARYELGEFWRIQSHLFGVYPSFCLNYIRLYRLFHALEIQTPRPQLIAIGLCQHMGDIVACQPVAPYLRAEHPNAQLIWICDPRYRDLLAHEPALDRILTIHCMTEWLLLRNLRFFDRIVELHPDGRYCPTCGIKLAKGERQPHVTTENYYDFGSLQTSLLLGAGLPPLERAPHLSIPDAVTRRIDRLNLPARYLVVHTTSNEKRRDWLPDKWNELVTRVLENWDGAVVQVGMKSGLAVSAPRLLDLCGKLSMLETAEVIRRAALFVGVDSGPAQFANAVDTPGVIIMGHYRSFKYYMPYTGPYANPARADLLFADGVAATLPVETVYQAVMNRLSPRAAPPTPNAAEFSTAEHVTA